MFQSNRSYRSPYIYETVKGQHREAETERDKETYPISEGLSPLPRHGGQGPEGKPLSHLGRRSRKKKTKGPALPFSSGDAGTPPGAIIITAIFTNNFTAIITNSPPFYAACNVSLTHYNLYLNMVLNAIYYFPMMYGYPMMFE